MRRVALAAVAAFALAAQPAAAATVSLSYEEPIPGLEPEAAYTLTIAGQGAEHSRLLVTGDAEGFTVRDSTAGLRADPGCAAIAPGEVRCATPEPATTRTVFAQLAGGNDVLGLGELVLGTESELRGGPGDDILYGGSGHDLLFGGSGLDGLVGGPGADVVDGGAGDDALAGGEGHDRASYQERREPIEVRLRDGVALIGEESDSLEGFEEVVGGRAADTLVGDAEPNRLVGGEGDARDRLRGLGGDDILVGHHAFGGPGNDGLDANIARCGTGADAVYRAQHKPRSALGRGCETVVSVFVLVTPNAIARGRRHVDYRVGCRSDRCRGTLELRDSDGRLGIAAFEFDERNVMQRVRIPLDRRAGRRATLRIRGPRAYQRDHFTTRLGGR